jgi:hypothetical protein
MAVLSIAQWLEASGFFTFLRESGYVYPIILTTHVVGMAMFGGLVLLTDLRLLGVAMRTWSVSDVIDQLLVLKRVGLAIVVIGGILLTGCKAEEYYHNKVFWTKMLLLALVCMHALVFRRSVYANTEELDKAARMPAQARLAGTLSLILWMCIALAGRGIGYIEPQLDHPRAKTVSTSVSEKARLPLDRIEGRPRLPGAAEWSCVR